MFQLIKLPRHSHLFLAVSVVGLLLTGCSIKEEFWEEEIVAPAQQDEPTEVDLSSLSPVDSFIARCNKCTEGDISELDDLISIYTSTYTGKLEWNSDSFTYQRIAPTQAFERCAMKAMLMGNPKGFNSMYIKQGRIARIARFFYATGENTQGAFWVQRLVNVKGEMNGLEIAGRVFIQDQRTIAVGVKLLEQSARLGNRNARQMLLGLMSPGSSYYRQITRNVFVEDDPKPGSDDLAANDSDNASKERKNKDKADQGKTKSANALAANTNSDSTPKPKERSARTAAPDAASPQAVTAAAATDNAERDMVPADARTKVSAAAQAGSTMSPPGDLANSNATINAIAQNTDIELDTPLELYERKRPDEADAEGTTAAQVQTTAAEAPTPSGTNKTSTNSDAYKFVLDPQIKNRMRHEEKLQEIEQKTQETIRQAQSRYLDKE